MCLYYAHFVYSFFFYVTPVSALTSDEELTRDKIVNFVEGEIGAHYLFGTHGEVYKNDFGRNEGRYWDENNRYWKFETTNCVWNSKSPNQYISKSCECKTPPCSCTHIVSNECIAPKYPYYRYWENCQGKGGGTTTSCVGVKHYDCIGLVDTAYRNALVYNNKVWRVIDWLNITHMSKVEREHLQLGDVGYVGTEHIGVYVGNNQFVHSNAHERGVVCDSLKQYNKWTSFGRALPSPLIQTVTITSSRPDDLQCSALNPDNLRGSNFDTLGTCKIESSEEQNITVKVTWDGGENDAKRHSWNYSSSFGYPESGWLEIDKDKATLKKQWTIDKDHLIDSDLQIQVRNEFGSIDTIDIHFELDPCLVVNNNFISHFNGAKYEDSNRDWDGDGKLDGTDKNGDPYGDKKIIWHNGKNHAVCDNFDILEGYFLTIEPGVTVEFANEKTLEAEHGDLIAQGTKENMIVFNKIGTLSGKNFSIEIDDSSSSKFSYCSVGRDVKVLLQDVALDVDQNIFSETSITINGGTPLITKNTFYDSVIDNSVGGHAESSPLIKENTFSGKKANIMIRPKAGSPVIAENHFSDTNTGIFAWGGSPSIIKNTFENCGAGIDVAYGGSPNIDENIMTTCSVGIRISGGSPTISKNTISNGGDGISFFDGSPRISKNTIIGNKGCGIWLLEDSSPSISSNTIFGNGEDCSKCDGEDQPLCQCWECKSKNGFIAWLMSLFSKF